MLLDYQVIDAVEASVYWKDLFGKYIGCNKYMAKMAGMNREQIIGNTDYLLPWKEQANKIKEIDILVISQGKKYELEEQATVYGDITKTFLSSKSPLLCKDGNIIGTIGVSIDITNYKLLEQEFEQTEKTLDSYSTIKNRFLKNISHEARIPLSSVLSISESLKDNWDNFDDKTKRQNIEMIFQETNRLSQFILNTFDVSKFLKNQIQPNFIKDNFSNFLQKVIKKYKNSFSNIEVDIEINHFDDYTLSFDPILITKVIKNILTNAIRYSSKKKKITISLYKSYLKNTEIPAIRCCITDEGVGVPENELESIFNSFTESTRTASQACGVGLGLSICKEIIESHAGYIWAENNLINSGTTFNFTIPTSLLASSQENDNDNEVKEGCSNIIKKDLNKIYQDTIKKPFAIIGISPFNSYFSAEKILEICEWINNEYDSFAIFVPDQISRYTFEALGYTEARVKHKIRKQDNYTLNKINKALLHFSKSTGKKNINIHVISELRQRKSYQDLYHMYSTMFLNDKEFRTNCLEVTEWVLLNSNKTSDNKIEEFQQNIAVQYFLLELPIMTHATDILQLDACDFVYHTIPKFLKHLYLSRELVSPKQRFLVLK